MDVIAPQLLLLALLAAWAAADTAAFGQFMVGQPLVAGWLAGLVVARPLEGLVMGASLQMLWSRLAPVGAAAYPDVGPATVGGVGTLLFWPVVPGAPSAASLAERLGFTAITASWRPEVDPLAVLSGLAIALLAGAAGQRLVAAMRRHNADLGRRADAAALRGDFAGVERANGFGLVRAAGLGVVVGGAALAAGAAVAGAARLLTIGASAGRPGVDPSAGPANPGLLLVWWIALAALGTALWSGGRRDWLWLAAGTAGGAALLAAR